MKSFIQNAVSCLEKSVVARQAIAPDNRGGAIVSGYSFLSSANEQEPLPEGRERRRAAIFYADVANFSRFGEAEDEDARLRLVEGMKIMEAHIGANNGRIVHTAGDAILAEFAEVYGALRCAVNVQLAARNLNARLNANQQLLFRIGVEYDETIANKDDIYGNAVNLAAWLDKLAHIGGIFVSASARLQLQDNAAFNFVSLGKQYVKNISEPVQVFWIELDTRQVVDADFNGSLEVPAVSS